MKILIQFSTTYSCEKAFSSVTTIKTWYRSQLEINVVLRLVVTTLDPNTHNLTSIKQQHPSHKLHFEKESDHEKLHRHQHKIHMFQARQLLQQPFPAVQSIKKANPSTKATTATANSSYPVSSPGRRRIHRGRL
ncbi:hypothetical protein TNCV_1486401 [Trichonephila clavipes]|nr:hypothetical protein TNCV_1486401 [Trichonephila clavipes]